MPVEIPLFPFTPPFFRVLYRDTFGATFANDGCTRSATDWSILTQPPNNSLTDGGVELEEINRTALPEIGTAIFRFVYGNLMGQTATPPELEYKEVRLQLSLDNATWTTAFWGQVICEERVGAPGSSFSQGVMKYHCVDGFARATKWILDYTGYSSGGSGAGGYPQKMGPCRGHPGYNYMLQSDGPLLGNKAPATYTPNDVYLVDGVSVTCHTYQGAFSVPGSDPTIQTAAKWFEIDMINHACASVKPIGEPLFVMTGASTPANHGYYVTSPQPVYPNETVWDFITRITNRQRGNGVVWLEWTDHIDGSISVRLDYCPLNAADITYTVPGYGTTATIEGATTAGQVYQFDGGTDLILQGDHRNIDSAFSYSDAFMHLYDMVETVGEQIEVAVTLCPFDGPGDTLSGGAGMYDGYSYSFEPRWTPADVTAFVALPREKRVMPYWNFLYQVFGLPRSWSGVAGNGFNTSKVRVDYRCDVDGTILVPAVSDPVDTPPSLVEMLGFLPFFEGYKYTGSFPEKTDNSTQYGLPQRRPAMTIIRPSGWKGAVAVGGDTDRWFLPGGQLPQVVTDELIYPRSLGDWFSPQVTVQPDGIVFTNTSAQNSGVRVISDPVTDSSLASNYQMSAWIPVTRIAFTVGLRLPHRLRFADVQTESPVVSDWTKARKRKVIYIENANLWLAAPNCIYDLSQSSTPGTDGYDPLRGALGVSPTGTTPAVLRDDRAFVYRYHKLASKWYLQPRSRITFGMKSCGFVGFTWLKAGTPTAATWPYIGDFITQIVADGASLPVATVVTSKRYNHQKGETIWETDWFDLEHT